MKAIYPGSFDPITNGHMDILEQSLPLFDKIIVTVCSSPYKKHQVELKDRVRIIQDAISLKGLENIEVVAIEKPMALVDIATELGAEFIIRGLRGANDLDYELQIAAMNRKINNEITTLFFTPSLQNQFVSSSIVRELLRLGKNIDEYVPFEMKKEI